MVMENNGGPEPSCRCIIVPARCFAVALSAICRCYVGEPAGNLCSLASRLAITRCATRWRLVAIYRSLSYLAG